MKRLGTHYYQKTVPDSQNFLRKSNLGLRFSEEKLRTIPNSPNS